MDPLMCARCMTPLTASAGFSPKTSYVIRATVNCTTCGMEMERYFNVDSMNTSKPGIATEIGGHDEHA